MRSDHDIWFWLFIKREQDGPADMTETCCSCVSSVRWGVFKIFSSWSQPALLICVRKRKWHWTRKTFFFRHLHTCLLSIFYQHSQQDQRKYELIWVHVSVNHWPATQWNYLLSNIGPSTPWFCTFYEHRIEWSKLFMVFRTVSYVVCFPQDFSEITWKIFPFFTEHYPLLSHFVAQFKQQQQQKHKIMVIVKWLERRNIEANKKKQNWFIIKSLLSSSSSSCLLNCESLGLKEVEGKFVIESVS